MQRSLIKNGFDYCGVIYLADGSKRVAFENVYNEIKPISKIDIGFILFIIQLILLLVAV